MTPALYLTYVDDVSVEAEEHTVAELKAVFTARREAFADIECIRMRLPMAGAQREAAATALFALTMDSVARVIANPDSSYEALDSAVEGAGFDLRILARVRTGDRTPLENAARKLNELVAFLKDEPLISPIGEERTEEVEPEAVQ